MSYVDSDGVDVASDCNQSADYAGSPRVDVASDCNQSVDWASDLDKVPSLTLYSASIRSEVLDPDSDSIARLRIDNTYPDAIDLEYLDRPHFEIAGHAGQARRRHDSVTSHTASIAARLFPGHRQAGNDVPSDLHVAESGEPMLDFASHVPPTSITDITDPWNNAPLPSFEESHVGPHHLLTLEDVESSNVARSVGRHDSVTSRDPARSPDRNKRRQSRSPSPSTHVASRVCMSDSLQRSQNQSSRMSLVQSALNLPSDHPPLVSLLPGMLSDYFVEPHQRDGIMLYVHERLSGWHDDHAMTVELATGIGPTFKVSAHEFVPKANDQEPLIQCQYLQDKYTHKMVLHTKYTPPLGLRKLDEDDENNINQYVEACMEPEVLRTFSGRCFSEESINSSDFQELLLQAMIDLFCATNDSTLKETCKAGLRLVLLNYIRGHTITIVDDTMSDVLEALRHPEKPDPMEAFLMPYTSARLVNRQLKCLFVAQLTVATQRVLAMLQNSLGAKEDRPNRWLGTFFQILCLAINAEEIHHTLEIMRVTQVMKEKDTLGPDGVRACEEQVVLLCRNIEDCITYCIKLFYQRYKSPTWDDQGSFGSRSPIMTDAVSRTFLNTVHDLATEQRAHLQSRYDIPLGAEARGLYTSRLVARFLLPFLDGPT